MNDRIHIYDRRRPPYFMVRLAALRAIRAHSGDRLRARTIGLYVLLCELGNEQRAKDQRLRIQANYEELTARAGGGLHKKTLKTLLTTLKDAEVAEVSTPLGPRGMMPTLVQLTELKGWYIEISVPLARHLQEHPETDLLRSLSLIATILELCHEQDGDHAAATRGEIANLLGLSSPRTLDGWVENLKCAGVLNVTVRPLERGGFDSNLWEVLEPPPVSIAREAASAATEPTSRSDGTDLPQPANQPGAVRAPTSSTEGTDLEQREHPPGADCAPDGALGAPHAGASDVAGENSRTTTSPQPLTPSTSSAETDGGEEQVWDAKRLCERLLEVVEPLSPKMRLKFEKDRSRWLAAAAEVLERYPSPAELAPAFAYIPEDHILGSRAATMPGFEKVVEELIFRANQRASAGRSGAIVAAPGNHDSRLSWDQARQRLTRAITTHGRDDARAAIAELDRESPLYAAFIAEVRWSRLCTEPLHFNHKHFSEIWARISEAREDNEEAA
jgi:hypothetical protein